MADSETLTLWQADRLYQSFPDFSAWPSPTEDDLRLWDRFASRLEEMRKEATPEALRHSFEVAVRAAAMDTGAIEGLYTVDRGFTMTVATQAFAWENALQEKGEKVRELFEVWLRIGTFPEGIKRSAAPRLTPQSLDGRRHVSEF